MPNDALLLEPNPELEDEPSLEPNRLSNWLSAAYLSLTGVGTLVDADGVVAVADTSGPKSPAG